MAKFRQRNESNDRRTYVLTQEFSAVTWLEVVWTLFPMVILFFIAYPSIALIYKIDTLLEPAFTLKIIGHQWYWSYESADFSRLWLWFNFASADAEAKIVPVGVADWDLDQLCFDAYMVPTEDLNVGDFRLLETTESVYLPSSLNVRLLVTSSDVLHSWAVPSLGLKVDAVPGRLNQAVTNVFRTGTFYGQCSEICGVNHGFMPIKIRVVPTSFFSLATLVFWQNG
jgi:cytochrome c oxidase subunit 2